MTLKLLTQKQVCELLNVSPSTLQKMRRERHLAFVQFGYRSIRFRPIRFRPEAVEEFARKHEKTSQ